MPSFREHTTEELSMMYEKVKVYAKTRQMTTKQIRAMAIREQKRLEKAEEAYHALEARAAMWNKASWRVENGLGLGI